MPPAEPESDGRWNGAVRRLSAAFFNYPLWAAPVLGAAAACGFQPLGLWPLTLLGVAGLVALVSRAAGWHRAALVGWLWGLGHFALGFNWIATAFSYQAKMPVALGWLGVLLVAAWCAVFPALACVGAWWFRRRVGALVPGFAGCWIAAEWLRSWLFTGFAWNPLGAVLLGDFGHRGFAAWTPWIGTYGLSGVAALSGAILFAGLVKPESSPSDKGFRFILYWAPLLILMRAGLGNDPAQGHIAYTLIQPNIAQDHLDDPAYAEAHFATEAALSTPAVGLPRRIVLWPESGVADYLRDGYPAWTYEGTTFAGNSALARLRLARVIGANSLLLTGAIDLVPSASGERIIAGRNVVTAIDDKGRVAGSYAKAHLVPFGEYLPLRWLLTPLGVARLVPGDIDLIPGPGPRTLDLGPYGKVGGQICYEIVFSGRAVDRAHRPDYIIAPTNDGWFGSWGPPQDLAQARLRAIEEGLPVLRSTTNGISAVIDADGIVRGFVPRGRAGRLDGLIPPAHPPTLFARLGNALCLLWAMVFLGLAALVLRRQPS